MLGTLGWCPLNARPIDKPAIIASGALAGMVIGIGISYYLNEKDKQEPVTNPTGYFAKCKKFLQKYPTLRSLLIITLSTSTGAFLTSGTLKLLTRKKDRNKPEPHDDDVPQSPEKNPEDEAWWQNLIKPRIFKNEMELNQCNNEWSRAIENHFAGKPDKVKMYKERLAPFIAAEKRRLNETAK